MPYLVITVVHKSVDGGALCILIPEGEASAGSGVKLVGAHKQLFLELDLLGPLSDP